MKRLLLLTLSLFSMFSIYAQSELSLIEIDQEEIDIKVQRFILQNQIEEEQLTEEKRISLEESVKEGLIMRKLLVRLAVYNEILIPQDVLDKQIAQMRGDYPEDEWVALLESQLYTKESFRTHIEEELLIDRLLQQEVLSKVTVTDDEALEYYNNNPDEFKSDFGTIDYPIVEEIIKENLLTTKGQKEVSLFMDNLYQKAMFVIE